MNNNEIFAQLGGSVSFGWKLWCIGVVSYVQECDPFNNAGGGEPDGLQVAELSARKEGSDITATKKERKL